VLIVDDDPAIRRLIAINLELEGFEVSQAGDGQDCLERAAEVDPAVVVLDVAMPRLDGLAATTALKQRSPRIKVVIVSARAQQADVRKGLEAGADAYLTKPFEPEVLIRTVRELANQAGTPDAQR
jgi:DNA-binding response OmpR family regulator